MEMEEIQSCKLSRIGNSRNNSNKIGRKGSDQYQDEDDEDGEGRKGGGGGGGGGGIGGGLTTIGVGSGGGGGFDIIGNESSRLRAWHSSRIFRVSRASGGKDRHSKVLTAKGLRDRRVRLSVSTAIQFYDLQDRLGYDQPSKAVEWLIKAASESISELPSLNTTFPDTPKQLSDEKRPSALEPRFDPVDVELADTDPSYQQQQQQQHISLSKSACSSTSETSKGSGLSLSRSEIRVKARERARERTAKDKEKEKQDEPQHQQNNTQNSSFTELLTGGGGGGGANNNNSPSTQHHPGFSNFVHKQTRQMPTATSMDQYFTSGLFGHGSLRNHYSSGYSGQSQFGNHPPHTMAAPSPYNVSGDHHNHHHHHHQELHQFSFLPDHMIPDDTAATGNEYNLNFSISSGIAGYNRGTLQSNSQQSASLPQLQRFSTSQTDGPNIPFFIGNVAASTASPTENQYPDGFDGRLQLCYGDGGSRHSDLKGKGKN